MFKVIIFSLQQGFPLHMFKVIIFSLQQGFPLHILLSGLKAYHFKNYKGYCFFWKRISLLKTVILFLYQNWSNSNRFLFNQVSRQYRE